MKSAILKTKMMVMLFALVFATSCSKDGATGPQGVAGQNGTNGIDGTNGQDGNANVTSVLLESQTISNGDNIFDVPALTQEIFDSGLVYAYVTVTGNTYWETLPLSLAQQIILEIDKIEVGKITLRATFTQSNLRLRFVLVEGNLSSMLAGKNIQGLPYEEAMDHFGLDY